MKRRTITTLKWALPLAIVLAITGTGWAKKKTFAPSVDGQLDPTRTSVTLSVDLSQLQCQTGTTDVDPLTGDTTEVAYSYSLKALLLQPSGRILAIGFSDPTDYDCVNDPSVIIMAIQGQSFKPGPTTVIYKMTETTTTTVTPGPLSPTPASVTVTTNVIAEWGATANLHP